MARSRCASLLHFVAGAVAALALLQMGARALRSSATRAGERASKNCLRSFRRGPVLFAEESEKGCAVTIVQCGDKQPPLAPLLRTDSSAGDVEAIPLEAMTTQLNFLYARRHGYRYAFYVFNTSALSPPRDAAWCRVGAVAAALRGRSSCGETPSAVVYLDQDAYIVQDAPLQLSRLRAAGRLRAIPLDGGDERESGFYWKIRNSAIIHSAALRLPNRHTPMDRLQRAFEKDAAWARALSWKDVVNTGGGWFEVAENATSCAANLAFLAQWWALGDELEGGRFLTEGNREQRVLNVLLSHSVPGRRQTALLEDAAWNSPRSQCIAHLYGRPNKRDLGYLAAVRAELRRRQNGSTPHNIKAQHLVYPFF